MASKDQMSIHNVNVDKYHIITLITSDITRIKLAM